MIAERFLLLMPLLVIGCSGSAPQKCLPGQSLPCGCTDGRTGAQVCNSSGNLAACTCTSSSNGNDGMAITDMASTDTASRPKRVFVTKLSYAATAVSDALCQNVAESVSLGGTWKAWLTYRFSTETRTAITRITSEGPWRLLTGELVFQNHGQLATTPNVPIQVTEMGTVLPANEPVWTGTTIGGVSSTYDCQGWSENRSIFSGTYGSSSSATSTWTNYSIRSCDYTAHLYCFETVEVGGGL